MGMPMDLKDRVCKGGLGDPISALHLPRITRYREEFGAGEGNGL